VAYKPSEARYDFGGSVKYLVYQTPQRLANGRVQMRTRVKRVYFPGDARNITVGTNQQELSAYSAQSARSQEARQAGTRDQTQGRKGARDDRIKAQFCLLARMRTTDCIECGTYPTKAPRLGRSRQPALLCLVFERLRAAAAVRRRVARRACPSGRRLRSPALRQP
jgi:hypothetical protein